MADSKADEILKQAQQFFVNKDYESALSVIREGKPHLDTGLFHYNLGSIYTKSGELGPGRYHLEKAKKAGFNYPMLWKNLNYIKNQPQVMDPTKAKDYQEVFVGKVLDIPFSFVSIACLFILAVLILLFRKSILNLKKTVLCVFVLVLLPPVTSIAIKKGYRYAIALKPVRVYEGPSKIYPDFGEIAAGSRVVVGKLHDSWYFLLSPSSISGWVDRTHLAFY
jgi:hypothetical protein